MSEKLRDPQTAGEGQRADKRLRRQEVAGSNERRQIAIKSLLETLPTGVDEKLTTVKAAQHVDKDRFQRAFRSLMKNDKP